MATKSTNIPDGKVSPAKKITDSGYKKPAGKMFRLPGQGSKDKGK